MWNKNKLRHRIKNAVEDWNSKVNNIIGKQQSYIYLLVKKLKEEAELVSWQMKSKKLGQPGQNEERHVKRDEKIKRVMEECGKSNDLYKCINALRYIDTM